MNSEILREQWLAEEAVAHIHGWDFSHLDGRYTQDDTLPWDYKRAVLSALRPDSRILDMDTGGGEFLLSLNHPHHLTSAIENYPPNVELCKQTLLPLGIDFKGAAADGPLPFPDSTFDLVLNRHGSFDPKEVFRVLKPGGVFLTQQVGEDNDRELVELVLPDLPLPYPGWSMEPVAKSLQSAGFAIETQDEAFAPIRFFDQRNGWAQRPRPAFLWQSLRFADFWPPAPCSSRDRAGADLAVQAPPVPGRCPRPPAG